jgi:heme-degrading monooxygenase HmoA
MYVVRDTFRAKPGKANALIEKFTAAAPLLAGAGVKGHRILVDEVADYWTVVLESTVEDLDSYFAFRNNTAVGEALSGYLDFVEGGGRRIYRVAFQT